MRLTFSAAALTLLGLSNCSHDSSSAPANQLMGNDFESLTGWLPDQPSLTSEVAHSGRYSIKVQNDIEYSLTYTNLLARLSTARLYKLRVTAYAYITQPNSPGMLTLQIVNSPTDGTSVFNQGINLGVEVKKTREWTKVSQVFTLPETVKPTNLLKLYLWRAGSNEAVYIDDLELTAEE